MGAGLVQRALLEPVDSEAKVVLAAMSIVALDTPKDGQSAGIYFGGRDYLIEVLCGYLPDPDTAEYRAALGRVKRALAKLKAAGSVEIITQAAGRRRARYKVLPQAVDNLRVLHG